MNFLSKTAPLEESISKMQGVLNRFGFETVASHEKHPLQNCYSINLSSKESPNHIYSNGKGVTSEASMASALGEYIERLQTNNFFSDFYLGEKKHYPDEVAFEFGGEFLDEELLDMYDQNGELCDENLVDFNSDYLDKIVALPFVKHSSGETIYFPINILNNLYVSNGLAAGNSPMEAKVQALSEIFERHVKMEIIKNGYALPKFPSHVVDSFVKISSDIAKLRELGYVVEVLDASLGGVFPVTAISLINPKNATLFVSFGAHPILEVSLQRTLSELMQGRDLDALDSFETPTFDMSLVVDSLNLESHFVDSNAKLGFGFLSSQKEFEFSPCIYERTTVHDEFEFLVSIALELDKEIYIREYDYLGFYSCQIVVPTISEVYPMEDLVYNNKNSGKNIRDLVLNFKNYEPDEVLDAIESLDDSLAVDRYIGVIFKHGFNMAEFKAQIYLLMDEKESALEFLESSESKLNRVVAELIRLEDGGFDFDDFKEAFYALFTREIVQKAIGILDKKEFLIDTTYRGDYLNIVAMYEKLEVAKRLQVR